MNTTTTTTRFNVASRAGAWWTRRRHLHLDTKLRKRCPPATVAAGQIPHAVRAAWVEQAPQEFPGVDTGDLGWLRCSLGLAQFFEACRLQRGQGPCALPSKAADSVWHLWLKTDPASLADWQQRYFDQVVEHREADDLGAPLDDCLARTWVGALRSEGRSPLDQRLPLLFSLDGELRLPNGWAYGWRRGRLVHRPIDDLGRPADVFHEHPRLAGAGLMALGLLTASEVEQVQRRLHNNGASSAPGGDGGGSDCSSSSDGGCSCGGGSGCGGGGGS